jgi:hypothetical protein
MLHMDCVFLRASQLHVTPSSQVRTQEVRTAWEAQGLCASRERFPQEGKEHQGTAEIPFLIYVFIFFVRMVNIIYRYVMSSFISQLRSYTLVSNAIAFDFFATIARAVILLWYKIFIFDMFGSSWWEYVVGVQTTCADVKGKSWVSESRWVLLRYAEVRDKRRRPPCKVSPFLESMENKIKLLMLPRIFHTVDDSQVECYPLPSSRLGSFFSRRAPAATNPKVYAEHYAARAAACR